MKQMLWTCLIFTFGWMACGTSGEPDATAADETELLVPNPMDTISAENIQPITWKALSEVTFENKFYEGVQEWLLFPSFGKSVQDLAGKPVSIAGYVLTLEPGVYALSANPFSSCFFCGGAGPESVLLLELTDKDEVYFTDEWRTFEGIFQLNDSDIDKLNYIITYARPVE